VSVVDRSRLPIPGADRPFHFPRIVKRVLPNGLELRAVTHRSVPVAAVVLLVPGGSSVDPANTHGLVSITAGLLDEGSRGQTALEVADRVARIGGELDLDVGVDAVLVGMTTLDRFLDTGLRLVHEVVTEPNLANDDFNRIRNLRLERLRQLKDHAGAMADRAFARVLYGAHPYGHLSLGTEASLNAITVDDSRALHAAMFTPAGSTLIIVGDRTEEELLECAAAVFESWRALSSPFDVAQGKPMTIDRAVALAPPPAAPEVRLGVVARPGAAQSELRIGHACARRSTPDYPVLLILNTILGGDFVSRLNQNLREEKGFTYGVRTGFNLRRGIGPFVMQTSVGTDVTAPAITEAWREIRDIAASRPATPEEVALAFASVSKGYPRGFETAGQVARSVAQLALHDLPDSYFEQFVPRLSQVTAEHVAAAAQRYLDPAKMTTLIVGDLDKIGGSLPALDLGAPQVLTIDL
jgi:predicted Zn-dependent peptidase